MPDSPYQDDPAILDEDDLWRRIPPDWIVRDENKGGLRPSTQAFRNDPEGGPMSVKLANEETVEDALAGHAGYFLVAITAGLARECAQRVAREPLDDNPGHAVVFGEKPQSVRKKFAREARWVKPPPSRSSG